MSKNTINALREQLFETLTALRDKDNPMDIERAKTISQVAQTIINTAKTEIEYINATGSKVSGFIEVEKDATNVTVHRLRG